MVLVTPLVMNVTFISNSGQAPVLRRAWRTILHTVAIGLGGLLVAANIVRAETITNLDAASNTVSNQPVVATNQVIRLPNMVVVGRQDSMLGIADSATQGTTGAAQLADRPILRSGEILETVPGVIITQHAGGGKANQYFLRGFNLDHGTDFAVFLDDMPLNLPSHAHGEGYSDMNTVIPEFVRAGGLRERPLLRGRGRLRFGWTRRIWCFTKRCRRISSRVEGGMYGYERGVFGFSQKLGDGQPALRRRSVSRRRPVGASG